MIISKGEQQIHTADPSLLYKDQSLAKCLACGYCKLLSLQPRICRQEECGQIYCLGCTRSSNEMGMERYCISCKKVLKLNLLTEKDNKFIENVELRCINYQNGCYFILSYYRFPFHVGSCLFSMQKCPNEGCNILECRNKMETHRMMCPYEKIKCKNCDEIIKRHEELEHSARLCNKSLLFCPVCKRDYSRFQFLDLFLHGECLPTYICQNKLELPRDENLRLIRELKSHQIQRKTSQLRKTYKKFEKLTLIKVRIYFRRKNKLTKKRRGLLKTNEKPKLSEEKRLPVKILPPEIKEELRQRLAEQKRIVEWIILKNNCLLKNKRRFPSGVSSYLNNKIVNS